jgi:hypothetical protein
MFRTEAEIFMGKAKCTAQSHLHLTTTEVFEQTTADAPLGSQKHFSTARSMVSILYQFRSKTVLFKAPKNVQNFSFRNS